MPTGAAVFDFDRTRIRQESMALFLRAVAGGCYVPSCCAAAARAVAVASGRRRDEGRRILVATGSLSVYMPTILEMKGIRVDGLLSTEVVVDGDVLTGEMATESCTWTEKARRVKGWLADVDGPVWGYGNMPHDGAMLELTDHPTVVPA